MHMNQKISDNNVMGLNCWRNGIDGNKLTQINSQGKGALDWIWWVQICGLRGYIQAGRDFKVVDEYANSSAKDDALQEATTERLWFKMKQAAMLTANY